ncbi:hypothetical protein J7337_000070 [Fusarium musae]|uniref:Uncharacterized protein n=1 Tax=Fusarium musae TaxID=1042133 RepID=A0A9P8DR82_9HYPO|nr:hypothetical protein J7337_000070 [Fusarium musae]KAG9506538.1 hypothetical protein J7337_000070 [Fusarium musae]
MDKKGHSAAGKQVRVSAKINCTTEKAREDGPPMNQCDNDQYKMGIIVNSTVNATISDKANLLEIVRDAADPATARSGDEDWDGEVVVACGYKILSRGANASTAEYDGQVSFVEEYVAKYSKSDEEDRPWPEYETAVEWVEEHKEDSDSGALKHASAYSARMALICFSLTVLLFYI